jgi:nucleoside-diphosphate-sugar epimerase
LNLLIGSTGFIGDHLVEYLFRQNEISKGIFRKGAHLKTMDMNGVQCVEADILDHHSLREAEEGVDAIYSLASPMPDTDGDFARINTQGITNILQVAREEKVKAIIHLSTLDVYGFASSELSAETDPRPSNDYQSAKFQADKTLLEFSKTNASPKITIIRAARAVGSGDSSLTVPLLRMIESGTAILPAPRMMSFSHPRDIAEAMYLAANNPRVSSTAFLMKSFDARPDDLLSSMASALGKQIRIKREGLVAKSPLPAYAREQLRSALHLGDQQSWNELGYSPKYDLEATCREIGEWVRRDPWATESS